MNYNEGEEKMIHDVRLSGLLGDGTNLTMNIHSKSRLLLTKGSIASSLVAPLTRLV